MSPEGRARKLSVVKALTRASLRMKNKENEDPLNNNMALPCTFKHSTPRKSREITDLDAIESVSYSETKSDDVENDGKNENHSRVTVFGSCSQHAEEPTLVISKIYDLEPSGQVSISKITSDVTSGTEQNVRTDDSTMATPTKFRREETPWKSLDFLNETAEHEFCKSLDQAKLFLSSSNLLEEIEADLPSSYSLARPLNHTFHSLMTYRTIVRLSRVDNNLTCSDILESRDEDDETTSSKKFSCLEMEAVVQKAKAKQAEKALVLSRARKCMEIEILESQKTLLLANLRYNAAIRELERLKMMREKVDNEHFGQITISEVCFESDDLKGTYLCTATERENVQCSVLSDAGNSKLYFKEPFRFQHLRNDFTVYVELFRHLDKEAKVPVKTVVIKRLKEMARVRFQKSLIAPRGSNHEFVCVARAELKLEHITQRKNDSCTLRFSEPVQHPVNGSSVTLTLRSDLNLTLKQQGFLNFFKRTWTRRWYTQNGYFLNSWLYPEDQENNKSPIESIYLPSCTQKVRVADLEVCIRPHSFIVVGPNKEEMLFSADSHRDLLQWMNHLNLIIEHIQLWKPSVEYYI